MGILGVCLIVGGVVALVVAVIVIVMFTMSSGDLCGVRWHGSGGVHGRFEVPAWCGNRW